MTVPITTAIAWLEKRLGGDAERSIRGEARRLSQTVPVHPATFSELEGVARERREDAHNSRKTAGQQR